MLEWKRLGEVCKTVTPPKKLVTKEYQERGLYPVIDQGQSEIVGFTDDECALLPDGEYVLFGDHTRFVKYHKGKFAQGADGLKILTTKESIIPRYLYYAFANIEVPTRGYSRHWSIAKELEIPIPSIAEQTRIVGILDTFTAAIDNLKKQIAQRRKQYEHYRDQLLDLEGKDESLIREFGDICQMIKGNGVQKADFVEDGVGCIHYGQIYTHYGSFTYTTNKFVSQEVFAKARKASKGDIIMTDTSENVEDICKSVAYLGEEDIAVSNHALIIKHNMDPKFLSYSTLTKSFFNQKRKVVFGVKVSGIKPEHLAKIKIYVPPIDEQQRIVSILDTFEQSIANLEQQLAQREKQYEYYRNQLLTFE